MPMGMHWRRVHDGCERPASRPLARAWLRERSTVPDRDKRRAPWTPWSREGSADRPAVSRRRFLGWAAAPGLPAARRRSSRRVRWQLAWGSVVATSAWKSKSFWSCRASPVRRRTRFGRPWAIVGSNLAELVTDISAGRVAAASADRARIRVMAMRSSNVARVSDLLR